MSDYLQIVTTTNTPDEAKRIATELVQKELAACVQISGPITSFYRWKGAIEHSEEWRCEAKSRAERFDDVAAVILKLHSYDVPEIIATPISAVSQSYLNWLNESSPTSRR